MRNEYYSDRKDMWKWSVLLGLAGDSHHIFQLAMLTPDNGTHGFDSGVPQNCDARVRDFFLQERRKSSYTVYGVEQLLPSRITVLNSPDSNQKFYSKRLNSKYFDEAILKVQERGSEPKIVFLDPDVGLEIKNSDDRHVLEDDISRIWDVLRPNDYLVLYQHRDRTSIDRFLRLKKEQLGRILNFEPENISHCTHGTATFFWLRRYDQHVSAEPPFQTFSLLPLPELRSATVFGCDIRYYDVGSGPPMLFIHGMGGCADDWAFCLDALASAHRVIAPDLLGFGRSAKPQIDYTIAGFVEVLERLLRTLDIERITLVGHSLGGWIAATFALQRPQAVDKLVLLDSAGVWAEMIDLPVDLRVSTLAHMREVFQFLFYDKTLATGDLIEMAYRQHLERDDGPTINSLLMNTRGGRGRLDDVISGLTMPTLIVWGEQDEIFPVEIGRHINRLVAGSTLQVIAQCGHLPNLEKPGELVRCVRQFVER